MIKVKGLINVPKSELEKVRAGTCTYTGGGLSIECDEFHIHIEQEADAIQADHLHYHL